MHTLRNRSFCSSEYDYLQQALMISSSYVIANKSTTHYTDQKVHSYTYSPAQSAAPLAYTQAQNCLFSSQSVLHQYPICIGVHTDNQVTPAYPYKSHHNDQFLTGR